MRVIGCLPAFANLSIFRHELVYLKCGHVKASKLHIGNISFDYEIKIGAQKVSSYLDIDKVMPDTVKAIFYSDWYYSAIRLITGIKDFQDFESISSHFGLSRKLTNEVIEFLITGLLIKNADNSLKVGPSRTH